ncbi:uncharacterized protein RAG0_04191 [Rhynchosporium agropyri]|uniref:Uncharacterized protein n=1 Tax=Rhynchosporium agropyri TaxID=914238 RepID=A0A1E1KBS2_9HELO|nr:uncharacterized protein RAG0_04191 [Rhynchosporium agropyri]
MATHEQERLHFSASATVDKSKHIRGRTEEVESRSDSEHHRSDQRRKYSDHFSDGCQSPLGCVRMSERQNASNGWKPVTLRAPILGAFIFISLAIITGLEVLYVISLRPENGGGLAFAADTDSLSTATSFGYLYLPTIIAVCYSIIWSWVDLDVKRLEPWFQLSRDGGATAEESLLLQYPYDFLPFIPFTAFKKKHWGVFYAGLIMIMVFWIITPLQSAIFNTETVSRHRTVDIVTSATLKPLAQQFTAMNANFMNRAYGIAWLNQVLPPFTTPEYAVMPFEPSQQSSRLSANELWTTTAIAFHTNLTCFPAQVVQEKTFSYTFSNGKGCVVPQIALVDTQGVSNYMMSYIGYHSSPQSGWALKNPNCSAKFSNNFLAVWASAASRFDHGVYKNMTAIFCETSYTSQQMHVSVNASSNAVTWGNPVGDNVTALAVEDVFNTTNFEILIGTGVMASDRRANLQDTAVLQQYSRIKDYVETLSDPVALQEAFQRAHQVLFTSAFSTLVTPILRDSPQIISQNQGNGTVEDIQGAIILVRPISIIVEAALGMIILLTLSLWFHSHYRPSQLSSDPASIKDIMTMQPPHGNTVSDDGTLTTTSLESALVQKKFRLSRTDNGTSLIIPMASGNPVSYLDAIPRASSDQPENPFVPVQPVELRIQFGFVFIAVLVSASAGITFVKIWSTNQNGLTIPTDNQVVRSIIENYAPTAFATLIEPVWTMLNRLLCLLQPFEELRKGKANASASVSVKYTSLPPQLAIWRAFRAKHFVLAAVCVVTVSTNLLAVALSALLEENLTQIVTRYDAKQQLTSKFNGTPIFDPTILSGPGVYFDHFYIALSNISEGTPLPPWLDKKFFYLPFDLKSVSTTPGHEAQLQNFRGATTGIGTQTTCTELSGDQGSLKFDVNNNGSSIQFSTSHTTLSGAMTDCFYPRGSSRTANETTADLLPFRKGLLGLEAVQAMKPSINGTDDGTCASNLIMGWARVSDGPTVPVISDTELSFPKRNVSKTFITCSQKLLVAKFDVVVDKTGRVNESKQTSDFITDFSTIFDSNVNINNSTFFSGPIRNETDLFKESTSLIASFNVNDFNWHNDSFTSDWMNTLLSMIQNSSNIVDPISPPPNATVIGPLVQELYEQLFAILISLNTHIFSSAEADTTISAEAMFVESRLFVSPTMFAMTIALLSLHIIVAIIYYARRPRRFLPRLPTSIASVIAFVSASRAGEDFKEMGGRKGAGEDQNYAYGRFIGTDGKTHVGIEQQRFVVPLKSRNPEVRRRKWGWNFAKEDERQPKTWI